MFTVILQSAQETGDYETATWFLHRYHKGLALLPTEARAEARRARVQPHRQLKVTLKLIQDSGES